LVLIIALIIVSEIEISGQIHSNFVLEGFDQSGLSCFGCFRFVPLGELFISFVWIELFKCCYCNFEYY